MTEQIIINNIDVNGCEFYNSSSAFCWAYPDKLCKYNTNCYYKQLKQKEQDYETLANQYNAVVEQNKQLQTELNNCKKLLDDFIKERGKQFLEETQNAGRCKNAGRCVRIEMNIDEEKQ